MCRSAPSRPLSHIVPCAGRRSPRARANGTSSGGIGAPSSSVGVKIEQMLKATGFTYKTHNPITWSIEFERKTIGKFRVIISNSEDIIVTFTTVTEKAKIRKTPQLMEALLAANHEYDYAKIGLDKDGDLFVRIDSPVRVTDAALLKSIIEQVANASGEIFTKNASFLKR